MKEFDESRLLHGPAVTVYVPPTPPGRPEDMQQDVSSEDPPEIHYLGVSANYWQVLEDGKMPFFHGTKVLSDDQMDWLRASKTMWHSFSVQDKTSPALDPCCEFGK